MNTTLHSATAAYLDAVRDALADQPAEEVAEILDDVTEHLEQVVAEFEDDPSPEELETRLGTPTEYAAELRAAAGLSEPGSPAGPHGRRRMAVLRFTVTWLIRLGAAVAIFGSLFQLADRWSGPNEAAGAYLFGLLPIGAGLLLWLVGNRSVDPDVALRQLPDYPRMERGIAKLSDRPWGAATVEFIRSLRPAWWLLRAWVASQALMAFVAGNAQLPFDASPAGLIVLAAAIVGSVWWGRRSVAGLPAGWPRLWSRLGNVGLAAAAPVVFLLMIPDESLYDQGVYYDSYEGFYHQDGSEIANVFVYDEDGQLVEAARLYDQEGRPVENVAPWTLHECVDEYGNPPEDLLGNVFPRPSVNYDDFGRCVREEADAPFGLTLPGTELAEPDVEGEPQSVATMTPDADLSIATFDSSQVEARGGDVIVGFVADVDDCLVVDDGGQIWLPVFSAPDTETLNGTLIVHGVRFDLGDSVTLVGAPLPADASVTVPSGCTGSPWLVSEVVGE